MEYIGLALLLAVVLVGAVCSGIVMARVRRAVDDSEPSAAERWRKEHLRTCAKQKDGAGTFMCGGRRIRLCPGFEESYYSTVGDPVTHFAVICNACGASCEGTEP